MGDGNIVRPSCGVLIPYPEKDSDKYVLVQQNKPDGKYGLPGGQIEIGERISYAVARETREETGLVIIVDGFLGVYPFLASTGDHIVAFTFLGNVVGGEILKEPTEEVKVPITADLGEFRRLDEEGLMRGHGYARRVLEDYLASGKKVESLSLIKSWPDILQSRSR